MKKIINAPEDIVEQMLAGMVAVDPSLLTIVPDTTVLARTMKKTSGVGLVSGGGSGHEPSHAGFVGTGMLDAAVCGAVFTSPTPDQILEAIKYVNSGSGVLCIVKNYSGDIMNFEMAIELAEFEDIQVDYIVVDDDIAVENSTYTQGKRGVAGTVFVHKILGYYAEKGYTLEQLKEIGTQLAQNLNTIGVALSGATVPAVGKPGFILEDDEIEFGVGIHGEPGYRKEKLMPSHALAQELIEKLKDVVNWSENERFALLINGLGGTPLMEQYVFANDVIEIAKSEGIVIAFSKVGSLMTSIDMQGISITLLKLEDNQWLEALESRVETVAW